MPQINDRTKLFPILIYQKVDEITFKKIMAEGKTGVETDRCICKEMVDLFTDAIIERKEIVIAIIVSKKDVNNNNKMGFSLVKKVEKDKIHFERFNKEYSKSLEQFVFVRTGNTLKFVIEKGKITPFGYVCKDESIEGALERISKSRTIHGKKFIANLSKTSSTHQK